jgi:hypothetical protein
MPWGLAARLLISSLFTACRIGFDRTRKVSSTGNAVCSNRLVARESGARPRAARKPVVVAKQRHPRASDVLDDDDLVVVRGGRLDVDVLRDDAQRYHAIYAAFGISVFAARGITVDELAQQPPLVCFELLTLVRVGCASRGGLPVGAHGPEPPPLHCGVRRSRRWRRQADELRAPVMGQPVP